MNSNFDRFTPDKVKDFRSPTQVDRDRLLYARSFARLAEITQVISADNGYVFHNRLTHSLKVAQVARRIAEKLSADHGKNLDEYGGLDVDATEAAGLAHDLGHPPFGHIAEYEINDRMAAHGLEEGFEGNAQSFRIVTTLSVSDVNPVEERSGAGLGLNLTRTTLRGILKYPWLRSQQPEKGKWGSYPSEKIVFDFARTDFPFAGKVQSLEANIMDLSDDITYASHDIIDFYCAGKIPLERLARDSQELTKFFDDVFKRNEGKPEFANRSEMEKAFLNIIDIFPNAERYIGSTQQEVDLWQALTVLIGQYVSHIELVKKDQVVDRLISLPKTYEREIAMLKQLTWHYVILNTELATEQYGQRRMIGCLFDVLFEAAEQGTGAKEKHKWKLFPARYEHLLRECENRNQRGRIVADFVSGMTEREVQRLYDVLRQPSGKYFVKTS